MESTPHNYGTFTIMWMCMTPSLYPSQDPPRHKPTVEMVRSYQYRKVTSKRIQTDVDVMNQEKTHHVR